MSKPMTHKGVLRGCDRRTPTNYARKILLRETKQFWVDKYGTRYSKAREGYPSGDWPMYQLDLDSIVPLEPTE